MSEVETLARRAETFGFTAVAPLDVDTIEFHDEVRKTCERNTCGRYGKSWSCPPGCGTPDECRARIAAYSDGLILQTTGQLEDEFDGEGMMEAGRLHGDSMDRFAAAIRKEFPGALVAGAGSCRRCESCTYPDAPCRHPDGSPVSMEALGMVVAEVCSRNSVQFYHGKNTITYVGCILI